MSSFKRGGVGPGTGSGKKPAAKPFQPSSNGQKTAVWVECEPPSPIIAVCWDRSSKNSWRLGSLLFNECRNGNNWGMFNYWKERNPPEWTNEHPNTCPTDVQLNVEPMEGLARVKQVMETSSLVSSFSVRTTAGQNTSLEDLSSVEWMSPEDLNVPDVQSGSQSVASDFTSDAADDRQFVQDADLVELMDSKVRISSRVFVVVSLLTLGCCVQADKNDLLEMKMALEASMLKLTASFKSEMATFKAEVKEKFKKIDDSLAARAHKEALRMVDKKVELAVASMKAVTTMSRKGAIADDVFDVDEAGGDETPVAHAVKVEGSEQPSSSAEPATVVAKRQRKK